jgi:hypothetical protein
MGQAGASCDAPPKPPPEGPNLPLGHLPEQKAGQNVQKDVSDRLLASRKEGEVDPGEMEFRVLKVTHLVGQFDRICSATGEDEADRRLIIIMAHCRKNSEEAGQQVTVLIDCGATGEFVSLEAANRLGLTLTEGKFGSAIEAFGQKTMLTQCAKQVELEFLGIQEGSGSSTSIRTTADFTVAPLHGFDFLLGMSYLESRRAEIDTAERAIAMRDEAGGRVRIQGLKRVLPNGAPLSRMERAATVRAIRGRRHRNQDDATFRHNQKLAAKHPELMMSYLDLVRDLRAGVIKPDQVSILMGGAWKSEAEGAARPEGRVLRAGEELTELAAHRTCRITITPEGVVTTVLEPQPSDSTTTPPPGGTGGTDRATINAVQGDADGDFVGLEGAERLRAVRALTGLESEFVDVFPADLPAGIPPDRGVEEFKIDTKPGAVPTGRYGARMSAGDSEQAAKIIKQLLTLGFIRPSTSPWGAPMFLVDKPDGSKRMVIDYRALNKQTVRNRWPLPRVGELFDRLWNGKFFSKIDLRTGYWQIRVHAESVQKTAFTSRFGHYEWLVLPMGLTNAPAAFMSLMEKTFREELDKFVVLFLDDILIFSESLEEHIAHLRIVLQRLRDNKLFAKRSKCQFFRSEVEFLGHYVGRDGLRMVNDKVKAVVDWPTPATQKEVEQFLGLAGYYRPFIKDLSAIAAPLTELTGTRRKGAGTKSAPGVPTKTKKKVFVWDERHDAAFAAVKKAVISAPCLVLPDPAKPFVVQTDASGFATGAVLMQDQGKGLQPIAFMSKKMNAHELRYPVHEQELLAIVNAMKLWRHHLSGAPFIVQTDHQSLQYVDSQNLATNRQVRWAMIMAEFDFKIVYITGDKNPVADALSRSGAGGPQGPKSPPTELDHFKEVIQLVHAVRTRNMAAAERRTSTPDQAEPPPPKLVQESAPIPPTVEPEAAAEVNRPAEALQEEEADLEQIQHEPLGHRVREAALADPEYQKLVNSDPDALKAKGLELASGVVFRDEHVMVVPDSPGLKTQLLELAHDHLSAGHRGRDRTASWLAERVWWPGMAKEAADYVAGCAACQANKESNHGSQGLPRSLETPERAWQTVSMDFMGPFPMTARGHNAIMVCVDKLTRYVVYIPLTTSSTTQEVWRLFYTRVVTIFGLPENILSDRDARFTAHYWQDLWALLGTKLLMSTAYHPQTDGTTERANKTLVTALRSFVDANQTNWDDLLPELQVAENTSRNASTKQSPAYMNFGRRVRGVLEAELKAGGIKIDQPYPGAAKIAEAVRRAAEEAQQHIAKAQAKQRADSMRGRREATIKKGDEVMLSSEFMKTLVGVKKLGPKYYGPFKVLDQRGNVATLDLPKTYKIHPTVNLDRLKPYQDGRKTHPDRTVRDHRPPALELVAGGDPVFEVEAILRDRGKGARVQYFVKWLGWPISSSTWQSRDDLAGAEELVAEYEKNRAESMKRKAESGEMPRTNRAQRISMLRAATARAYETARWAEQSVPAGNEPAPATSDPNDHSSTEHRAQVLSVAQQRQKNKDAAMLTRPVDPDRPLPDKNGAIVMPTQRCTAETKKGGHCKAKTAIGQYCWIHLQQMEGLRVRTSTVPGIGKGLFAMRFIAKGSKIAEYSGDLFEITDEYDETKGSKYVLEINSELLVCAARTNAGVGRWANDARQTAESDNAYLSCDQSAKRASIKASRDIQSGEEIFVPYSDEFWVPNTVERRKRRLRIQAARRKRASRAIQVRGGADRSNWAIKTGRPVGAQGGVNSLIQDVTQFVGKIGAWLYV